MRLEKEISIYKANLFYLVTAIVFLFASAVTQLVNLYFSILITEVLIIAGGSILFMKRRGFSFKKAFRLNSLGFKNSMIIFSISLLTYPIVIFFQAIFVAFLQNFTELLPDELPMMITNMPLAVSVFFIAIIPGVCEEIMFRGTMLRAYAKFGRKKAIIMSSILFGIFHFNLGNFIGPTILGLVFGIMVYKTNSIFASMLAHAMNNSIAIGLSHIVFKNMDAIEDMAGGDADLDMMSTLIGFALIGLIVLLLMKLVKSLLNRLVDVSGEDRDEDKEIYDEEVTEGFKGKTTTRISSYIPLMVVAFMFFVFNIIFIFA